MGFDTSGGRLTLSCPLCENTTFQREESGRTAAGPHSHRMTLMVCRRCRYVLHFYDEHSVFDLD